MLNINKIVGIIKNSQYRSEADFSQKVGISYQGWLAIKKRGKTTNRRAIKIAKTLEIDVKEILDEAYYTLYKDELSNETNTGFSSRLRELIEYIGIGVNEFGRETGIPASSISTILSRDNAHIHFIYKIAQRYRWLNIRWLITGEGEIKTESVSIAADDTSDYHVQRLEHLEEKIKTHNIIGQKLQKEIEILSEELKKTK